MKRASLLALALVCAAVAPPLAHRLPASAVSPSYAQNCPDSESPGYPARILDAPEVYIGCPVRIEGVLEESESESYPLRASDGRALQVRSWAPSGKEGSHYPSSLPEGMKTMSDFVGRRLRVVGQLVEAKDGGVVLEVSAVEDLSVHSE